LTKGQAFAVIAGILAAPLALAQDAATAAAPVAAPAPGAFSKEIDSGATAWMIVASVLVLLMTPGLALFYGGMVRRKNVLSTFLHSFIMMGIVSIVWMLVGYTIAFGHTDNGWIGDFKNALGHVPFNTPGEEASRIPAALYMLYQMMFAIITPALISGALAERMKFSAYVIFTTVWLVVVYCPVACWVWNSNGWANKMGALDFAGGTVVHLASGMAALAAAIMLGKRKSLVQKEPILPHSLPLTLLGGGLLWVGWIGFNAGSATDVNPVAISGFAATQLAAAAGMLGWMLTEKLRFGKPTALGAASGLVAGLVAITPASGYVDMLPGTFIGLAAGVICSFAVSLKSKFGFDDALDVVGVHGVGGFLGAILTGVFASVLINHDAVEPAMKAGRGALIMHQFLAAVVIGAFSFAASLLILAITKLITKGLRATEEEEDTGLDITQHGEAAYNL